MRPPTITGLLVLVGRRQPGADPPRSAFHSTHSASHFFASSLSSQFGPSFGNVVSLSRTFTMLRPGVPPNMGQPSSGGGALGAGAAPTGTAISDAITTNSRI